MTQPSTKSEIAAAYNDWAETYDTDANRTRELAAVVLREIGLKLAGRDVVEVGCGTGRNTEWLAQQAGQIIGLDFSEGMLQRAQSRVRSPHVRFLHHDVRNPWPLPPASADLVIAMLILEHVENIRPMVAEAARALTDGGELFICELHPMRQLLGGQAQFNNARTGEHHRVPAFLHDVSDYVNAGLTVGFELASLGEWRDADMHTKNFPRLLTLRFRSVSQNSRSDRGIGKEG